MKLWSVGLLILFACNAANAQQSADPLPRDESIDQVICRSKSLTVCQDGFCYVSFDGPEQPMLFDFVHQTYVFPAVSPATKPMQTPNIQRARQHTAVKFTIELAHGTSNVEFIANQRDADRRNNGSLDMSAASRIVYPASADRSEITAINAMACEKNPT